MAKQRVILRTLQNRWYKRILVISAKQETYFDKLKALNKASVSGFLIEEPRGCIFDLDAWPFSLKYFDLIILDDIIFTYKKQLKDILEQVHFCLADDGDLVIVSTKGCFAAELLPKAISSGFINDKLTPISSSENRILNNIKKLATREFIAFFKKSRHFDLDSAVLSSKVAVAVKV
ncbi:class I SAM-dependent methyltransferase [Pseudofrancisella aestuarii]|uniref:Class I SAM-dependent methyltransferase n=1 Tax=Pseudofrancisella aestuarii TaxID=2670347 RepID=A0ABV9TAA3_9GAMM|nr:class I SAM-dependent methyltransferase [Pseudofrancisella aestuarii]